MSLRVSFGGEGHSVEQSDEDMPFCEVDLNGMSNGRIDALWQQKKHPTLWIGTVRRSEQSWKISIRVDGDGYLKLRSIDHD